jgi:hypothetical protein
LCNIDGGAHKSNDNWVHVYSAERGRKEPNTLLRVNNKDIKKIGSTLVPRNTYTAMLKAVGKNDGEAEVNALIHHANTARARKVAYIPISPTPQ